MITERSGGLSRGAAIYLDYGADSAECDECDFRICERGLCFKSRWHFTPGTQLAVVLSYAGADGEMERLDAEATVASCDPSAVGCYDVVALFIELPEKNAQQFAEWNQASRKAATGDDVESRVILSGASRT